MDVLCWCLSNIGCARVVFVQVGLKERSGVLRTLTSPHVVRLKSASVPSRTSFKFTFKFKFEYSRRSLEGLSKPWLRPHAVNPVNVIDLVLNFSSLFLLLYSSFFFLRSSPASQPARRTAVARAHRGLHFDFDGFPSLSTSSQTSLCIFDRPRPRRRSLARLSCRVLCLLARRLHRRRSFTLPFSRHPAPIRPIHTLLRSTRSRKASRPRLSCPMCSCVHYLPPRSRPSLVVPALVVQLQYTLLDLCVLSVCAALR